MILDTERMLRLTGFILGSQGQPFSWGFMDCNTFAARVNDILTGKKTLGKIQFQYNDQKSAIRFQRNYLTAPQYLHTNGWRQVQDNVFLDGDMLLVADKHYARAHVVYNKQCWSVHETAGVCAADINQLPEYTHWRLP
jgi:hypothetical protein